MSVSFRICVITLTSLIFFNSCEKTEELTLANKLNQTVWEAVDWNPCDCGFNPVVGFKGSKIFELTDHGGTSPLGCFPYNESVRSYGGEVINLELGAEKISFKIVEGSISSLIEIELIGEELVIRDTKPWHVWSQKYKRSTIRFNDYC
jgi:hypothetical protein